MRLLLQAKRTNIGIALITHPRVLFLDEPTSGLDSYTAHEVSHTLLLPPVVGSLYSRHSHSDACAHCYVARI